MRTPNVPSTTTVNSVVFRKSFTSCHPTPPKTQIAPSIPVRTPPSGKTLRSGVAAVLFEKESRPMNAPSTVTADGVTGTISPRRRAFLLPHVVNAEHNGRRSAGQRVLRDVTINYSYR